MRARHRPRIGVELPQARAMQGRHRVVHVRPLPRPAKPSNQVPNGSSRLLSPHHPRLASGGPAEGPQQRDGLVEGGETVGAIDIKLRQQRDQAAGVELTDLHGEAQAPQEPPHRSVAPAELARGQRPLSRQEPVRAADDGLRIVRFAVVDQEILACLAKPVLGEESRPTEPVILPDRRQDGLTRDVLLRHNRALASRWISSRSLAGVGHGGWRWIIRWQLEHSSARSLIDLGFSPPTCSGST